MFGFQTNSIMLHLQSSLLLLPFVYTTVATNVEGPATCFLSILGADDLCELNVRTKPCKSLHEFGVKKSCFKLSAVCRCAIKLWNVTGAQFVSNLDPLIPVEWACFHHFSQKIS